MPERPPALSGNESCELLIVGGGFTGDADNRLEELGEENIKELLETLERWEIDACYEKTGITDVALDPKATARLREEYELNLAAGAGVVWLDKEDMRGQANSLLFFGGCWYRDGQDGVIDPFRLCLGLKDVLLNTLGVRIFEDAKLIQVQPEGSAGMKAICTDCLRAAAIPTVDAMPKRTLR